MSPSDERGYWHPSAENPYLGLEGDALDDDVDAPAPAQSTAPAPTRPSVPAEAGVEAPLPVPTMRRPAAHEIPRRSSPMAAPAASSGAVGAAPAGSASSNPYVQPAPYATPTPLPTDRDRLARAEAARAAHDARGGYAPYAPAHAAPAPAAPPRARRSVPARKLRFWKWYRTLPIVVMLIAGFASLVVNYGLFGVRELLYPLHYEDAIEESAEAWGIDPLLVASVIRTESGWDASAISDVGAVGLMQLMPETAAELAERGLVDPSLFDPANLTDPVTNIAYGTAYLAYCVQNTGSLEEAIAAYNAGIGAANAWASTPSSFVESIEYPETTSYLERVLSALGAYTETYPEGVGGE